MKKVLMMLVVGLIIVSCSGCSTTVGFEWDGGNWGFKFGGSVPEIPLINEKVEVD